MKQPLPAKYAKMTVCTFWILKQLKSKGMLTEKQMTEAAKDFSLTNETDDQILYFKDLVENFKDHENYLKMYANSCNEVENEKPKKVEKCEKEAKKKELSEEELIKMMLSESEDESEDTQSNDSDYYEEDTDTSYSDASKNSDTIKSDKPSVMNPPLKEIVPIKKKIKLIIRK
jgi:hypothetical protein